MKSYLLPRREEFVFLLIKNQVIIKTNWQEYDCYEGARS